MASTALGTGSARPPLRPPVRTVAAALAVTLAATLAGCTSARDGDPSASTAQDSPMPEGGTADAPSKVTPHQALMEWVPAPGSVDNTVTTNGSWFLTVGSSGTEYALDGQERSFGSGNDDGTHITNALLNADWAVVVRQDQAEKKPAVAEVTRLSIGQQFTIDADTDVPTTNGGTWALGGDTLVHATVTESGDYCLASIDLEAQKSTVGWCTGPGQGFTAAHVTDAATTLLTFDDSSPSCRTVGVVDGKELVPFEGVPECKAWDSTVLEDDSVVWSLVPDEEEVEAAEFFARVGDSYYALGSGTSGTIVPCAGAAYFVRDPQKAGDPAALLRWDGRSLAVVYEAPPGQSFLEAPRCGDNALVVTALSEGGDEQVMAALG